MIYIYGSDELVRGPYILRKRVNLFGDRPLHPILLFLSIPIFLLSILRHISEAILNRLDKFSCLVTYYKSLIVLCVVDKSEAGKVPCKRLFLRLYAKLLFFFYCKSVRCTPVLWRPLPPIWDLQSFQSLKPSFTEPYDVIPLIVLKKCAQALSERLAFIFNASMLHGEVPEV